MNGRITVPADPASTSEASSSHPVVAEELPQQQGADRDEHLSYCGRSPGELHPRPW